MQLMKKQTLHEFLSKKHLRLDSMQPIFKIQQPLIDWSISGNFLQSVVPVTGDSIKIRERLRAHAINQDTEVMRQFRLRPNNSESPSASATHRAQRVTKKRPSKHQNGSRSRDNKGFVQHIVVYFGANFTPISESIPPKVRKKFVVQISSEARSTSFVARRRQVRDDLEVLITSPSTLTTSTNFTAGVSPNLESKTLVPRES
ncbi:hypothetical protein F5876DRAFT_78855 [Lentinula aff. lateritia]|uniref:Uncharacterized protein n=1 Tax=Lentinula aff. lateritia TaxID=2804960 RepID=A0ACC1TUL4_9AGAR|nr:hypothetical protein F5876DRAFT_78855 [Lentinula aff. lateritia]